MTRDLYRARFFSPGRRSNLPTRTFRSSTLDSAPRPLFDRNFSTGSAAFVASAKRRTKRRRKGGRRIRGGGGEARRRRRRRGWAAVRRRMTVVSAAIATTEDRRRVGEELSSNGCQQCGRGWTRRKTWYVTVEGEKWRFGGKR